MQSHVQVRTRGIWKRKGFCSGWFFAAASRRSKLACTSPSQSYRTFTRIISAPLGNLGMEHTHLIQGFGVHVLLWAITDYR